MLYNLLSQCKYFRFLQVLTAVCKHKLLLTSKLDN